MSLKQPPSKNEKIVEKIKKDGHDPMKTNSNNRLVFGVSILYHWARHPSKTDWSKQLIYDEYTRLWRIAKDRSVHLSKTPSQFKKLLE